MVCTSGTQPSQTDACGRHSTQQPEGATTGVGIPGLGLGKPGRCSAGTPAEGPANQYLPASRTAAPAADGPLLPETQRAARSAPARTPTACEGPGPTATLRPYRRGDPGIVRPGESTGALLVLLCPASPILMARPRVANSPGRATGGGNVDIVSLTPTPRPFQDRIKAAEVQISAPPPPGISRLRVPRSVCRKMPSRK